MDSVEEYNEFEQCAVDAVDCVELSFLLEMVLQKYTFQTVWETLTEIHNNKYSNDWPQLDEEGKRTSGHIIR